MISVPVGFGELADKVSILMIKLMMLEIGDARDNVSKELNLLERELNQIVEDRPLSSEEFNDLFQQLSKVNQELWDIEDELRQLEPDIDHMVEQTQADGMWRENLNRFVQLARAVYKTNDERSRIKREINRVLGSGIVEEKVLPKY